MSECIVNKVIFSVTSVCNLHCKRCSGYMPYISNPAHISLADNEKTMDRVFSIMSFIQKVTISGGEPLLHPQLEDIIKNLFEYKAQFASAEIITNGSIKISDALLETLRAVRPNIKILIDNYGSSLSKYAFENQALLSENQIDCEVRNYNGESGSYCGGWVDFGDLRKKRNDPVLLFAKCASIQKLHFCFTISNGLMMPCAPYRRMTEMGMLRDQVNKEFLNLYDDTLSDEEQRHILEHILNSNSLKACAYCDGLTDDSVRYQPAEQLKKEEFACIKNGARTYHEVLEMLESDKKL